MRSLVEGLVCLARHNCQLGWIRVIAISCLTLGLLMDPLNIALGRNIKVPADYTTIQQAINAAQSGDQIWVTQGTYNESIQLVSGVSLYGGFRGNETSLDQRHLDSFLTIIDGSKVNSGEPVWHVVTMDSISQVVLDGFTITGGDARGGQEHDNGGGLYCKSLDETTTVTNCTFRANRARFAGGAICGQESKLSITRCTFINNVADDRGGALFTCNGLIEYNVVRSNAAIHGGGLSWCGGQVRRNTVQLNTASASGGGFSFCHGTVADNLITSNTAQEKGGGLNGCDGLIDANRILGNTALVGGGGVSFCGGTIQNNLVYGNQAPLGGGFNVGYGTVRNNTIWGNTADSGGGLSDWRGPVVNCIIWGNTGGQIFYGPTPSYSCVQDWSGGGIGNISADPLLNNPAQGDFRLLTGSPCLGAGSAQSGLLEDFEGNPRPTPCSIGALEAVITPPPPHEPVDIHVPEDYAQIQPAIDAALAGDRVIVAPGTYPENIHFDGKNITLTSNDPTSAAVVAATVIDGQQAGPVVTFAGSELSSCTLTGFTIAHGMSEHGGGIWGQECLATISNNAITSNTSTNLGGGLFKCNGLIQDNLVAGNAALHGGGLSWCGGTIRANTIRANTASIYGGGLSCCHGTVEHNWIESNQANEKGGGLNNCDGLIDSNRIMGNTALIGGGGICYSNGTIQNNLVYNNIGVHGGGLLAGSGVIRNCTFVANQATYGSGVDGVSNTVVNCIIWGNRGGSQVYDGPATALSFSCIQDWNAGQTGNISSDPLFVDAAHGNFRLKPDSLCIDAGIRINNLASDLDGNARGVRGSVQSRGDGSFYDMGACEYNPPFPTSYVDADMWMQFH